MNPVELEIKLGLHLRWLRSEEGGSRANLSNANLYKANLSGANLYGANLYGANLSGANLYSSGGLNFAQCSFSGHGKRGRMLTCALIKGEKRYFCGCFNGDAKKLHEYILKGDERYRNTRMVAFKFVTEVMISQIAAEKTAERYQRVRSIERVRSRGWLTEIRRFYEAC